MFAKNERGSGSKIIMNYLLEHTGAVQVLVARKRLRLKGQCPMPFGLCKFFPPKQLLVVIMVHNTKYTPYFSVEKLPLSVFNLFQLKLNLKI